MTGLFSLNAEFSPEALAVLDASSLNLPIMLGDLATRPCELVQSPQLSALLAETCICLTTSGIICLDNSLSRVDSKAIETDLSRRYLTWTNFICDTAKRALCALCSLVLLESHIFWLFKIQRPPIIGALAERARQNQNQIAEYPLIIRKGNRYLVENTCWSAGADRPTDMRDWYFPENKPLFDRLSQGGTLVSLNGWNN